MPIESYIGVPGITIDIKSIPELYEALDALHTQIMDLGEISHPALNVLETAMDNLTQEYPDKILP